MSDMQKKKILLALGGTAAEKSRIYNNFEGTSTCSTDFKVEIIFYAYTLIARLSHKEEQTTVQKDLATSFSILAGFLII